jgi:hypothetical protein
MLGGSVVGGGSAWNDNLLLPKLFDVAQALARSHHGGHMGAAASTRPSKCTLKDVTAADHLPA